MPSRLGKPNKKLCAKTMSGKSPTLLDIAWAAGIYEGEGSVCGGRLSRRSFAIYVVQKDRWILGKLKELFGGGVYLRSPNAKCVCHSWTCSGPRARGFAYTIFSFLSPRRRLQLRQALVERGW